MNLQMSAIEYLSTSFSNREYLERSNMRYEKSNFKKEELKYELKGEKKND